MKKSDVIRRIQEILKGAYDYPEVTIMDNLERMGMRPPEGGWEREHWEKKREANRDDGTSRSRKKFNSFEPL